MIMGRGPETDALRRQWAEETAVTFYSPDTNEEVLDALTGRDVLVFPTRFEGFPVSLLEAMAAGLVPVASNLPGGLRELVREGENGFLCKPGAVEDFAARIAWLHHHRDALENMSHQAASLVNEQYNAEVQSPVYQAFFSSVAADPATPRHHNVREKIGSRLDQRWLPNTVTRLLRRSF
jgi:glycosyltransferase involved in cell wall biosynthesis